MKYAHYDPQTGRLLGWYTKEIHGDNIPEPYIEVDDTVWQEALDKNYNYVDAENKTLSYKDFRTLDQIKQAKKLEIESTYVKKCYEPIDYEVNGVIYTFQADEKSQNAIFRTITGAPQDFTTDWLDIDNNAVSVTLDDLKGLAQVIVERNEQLFQQKVQLKKQVDSATTKEEVESITWS